MGYLVIFLPVVEIAASMEISVSIKQYAEMSDLQLIERMDWLPLQLCKQNQQDSCRARMGQVCSQVTYAVNMIGSLGHKLDIVTSQNSLSTTLLILLRFIKSRLEIR
jgi:hypothetical protein